jgi:hypothetical protein
LWTFHNLTLREVAGEVNVTVKVVQKHLAAALVRINEAKNEEAANAHSLTAASNTTRAKR